ncbi:MAG: chromosomal replication initiator protein DnaA [Verrucomicrobia bacterium]|nr:MAG: chromosomal replication initiator protein DnaA [Verrucomicrobiota bacterium]
MQTSAEKIWAAAQAQLRTTLNPDVYNLWFAPLRVHSHDDHCIVLEVANDFCGFWLKDNYVGLLQDVIAATSGKQLQVRFKIASGPDMAAPLAAPSPKTKNGDAAPERPSNGPELGFNSKYTFDTFVVGNNNNFAHSAAQAVAKAPGKSYNPLFVYGGVGLGKTHLLHAIGHYIAAHKKGARIAYVSSEKFTNEYIDSLQNNQPLRFRKKYRQMDVLLLDDIEFLAGKDRIQEEFFHTFNALHEGHKQIVLTSDRPPTEIPALEHRLVSRFEWGLSADLHPPDAEVRLAILQKKAQIMGVEMPAPVLDFMAQKIRSNIRRLEGALIRVVSYATLTGKKVTLDLVEGILREVLHEEGRFSISIDAIQRKVAEHFDIRLADMTSKRRPENIAFPRQIAMFLSRTMTEASLSEIGEAFGGRDHGTVLHACRLVKNRMDVDASVRQVVNYLEKHLAR